VNSFLWLPLGLVALNLYALLLVLMRAPAFGTKIYRPMILNIGLSIAPALVLLAMVGVMLLIVYAAPGWSPGAARTALYITIAISGIIWLLLLPNAAYLVTELNLSHRKDYEDVPLWYDIVLVLTLALSGVFNTLANIAVVQVFVSIIQERAPAFTRSALPWIALTATLIAVSFGMYLGRYLRLNSWDLLHPSSMFRKLTGHFKQKTNRGAVLGFVTVHSLLFLILYLIVVLPSLTELLN